MEENTPYLLSMHPMEGDFRDLRKIVLDSDAVSIGRAKSNTIIIPFLSISRHHCRIRKTPNAYILEDNSSFGIDVNGSRLGKGSHAKIKHGDVIQLEPSGTFLYTFHDNIDTAPATKRMRLDTNIDTEFITDMKTKFELSQNNEMGHIAEKIYYSQQRQMVTKQFKEQLEKDYEKRLTKVESNIAMLTGDLSEEGHEDESKTMELQEERDSQLADVRQEMDAKLEELENRISQLTRTESELHEENKLLKERLCKEREEFLLKLSKENSSKQELMQDLEAKMKEQEIIRLRERHELEEQLRIETEQLRTIKENELKELAERKIRREEELLQELSYIKQNLEGQVEQMELQRCQAEEQLIIQMNEMKKTNEEDKEKIKQLILDRQNIESKLSEAQRITEVELKKLKAQVTQREIELSILAAERIQKQAEMTNIVVTSLQSQLEKIRNQLVSVENDKKKLLAKMNDRGECSTKHTTYEEIGELMESELQCSICAELFVDATTLNCSHTFCRTCITMWTRKKNECAICRTEITSECKSLVLDSFINKMVENFSDDVKLKRDELVKSRQAQLAKMTSKSTPKTKAVPRPFMRSRYRRAPTSNAREMPTVDLTGVASNSHSDHPPYDSILNAIVWGLNGEAQ